MQFRAVAFVLAEAILRETGAEVAHNRVARDFGDDTRGRDAETVAIAVDDGGLRQWEGKDGQAVDEHVLGLHGQSFQRRPHRFVSGAQDIDRVDLDGIDHADSPENGVVCDQVVIDLLAFFRQELLRIVQLSMAKFFGKNDGGGDNGAGERAAPGFIDARDRRDAEGAEFAFMPEATAAIHRRQNTETLKN